MQGWKVLGLLSLWDIFPDLLALHHPAPDLGEKISTNTKMGSRNLAQGFALKNDSHRFYAFIFQIHLPLVKIPICRLLAVRSSLDRGTVCGACQNGSQIEDTWRCPQGSWTTWFLHVYQKNTLSIIHMYIQMPSYLLLIYKLRRSSCISFKFTWGHRSLGTVEKSRGFLNLAAMPKWSILYLIGPI